MVMMCKGRTDDRTITKFGTNIHYIPSTFRGKEFPLTLIRGTRMYVPDEFLCMNNKNGFDARCRDLLLTSISVTQEPKRTIRSIIQSIPYKVKRKKEPSEALKNSKYHSKHTI